MIPWILAALAVERITEIILTGEIFRSVRFWVLSKDNFWSGLLGCGFCLSAWVSALFAWALPGSVLGWEPLNIMAKTFALMGLANIIHEGLVRWFVRMPIVLAFQNTEVKNDTGPSFSSEGGDPSGYPQGDRALSSDSQGDGSVDAT